VKNGFTLVELVIVIVIFTILASIAVPQYLTGIERAKGGKARIQLMVISKAEKMYAADNNGAYIACTNATLQANLGLYTEMTDIAADTDWSYDVATGAGTFTATATKRAGQTNAGQTITYTGVVWGGTFVP
jgi:type IV pilus assembly protein PilE